MLGELLLTGVVLGAHLGTYHAKPGYNDFNPGVYAKLENGVTAGVYHNSYKKTSVYLAYSLERGMFAASFGAVSGYDGIRPLVVPSVKFGDDEFAMRVTFLPQIEKTGTSALHFSIERKFK